MTKNNQKRGNKDRYKKCGKKEEGTEHYVAIWDRRLLENAANRGKDDKEGKNRKTWKKENVENHMKGEMGERKELRKEETENGSMNGEREKEKNTTEKTRKEGKSQIQ